jgi:hypothetical protein
MTKERRNVFVVMAFGKMPRVGRKLKVAEPQDGRENNTGSGKIRPDLVIFGKKGSMEPPPAETYPKRSTVGGCLP